MATHACRKDTIFRLGPDLPDDWRILDISGRELLSASTHGPGDTEASVAWPGQPPLTVEVRWVADEKARSTSWPVNVQDIENLPTTEHLRDLSLSDLLSVLTASRSLHQSILRLIERRNRVGRQPLEEELDPLRRVNTETFILMRARRVAAAIEYLQERLERPVINAEALDWRLRGPVGVMALEKAIAAEVKSKDERLFYLSELALMLKRVRAQQAAVGGLSAEAVRERLRNTVEELHRLGQEVVREVAPKFSKYAEEAFAEARR